MYWYASNQSAGQEEVGAKLPEQFEARLLTRTVNGQGAAGADLAHRPAALPGQRVDELYQNRWEIELGYREMKHSLQQHRLTLRNKKPDEGKAGAMGLGIGL